MEGTVPQPAILARLHQAQHATPAAAGPHAVIASTSAGGHRAAEPLPAGVEERWDEASQRPYFVNHRTRTTSWQDPRHGGLPVGIVTSVRPSPLAHGDAAAGSSTRPPVLLADAATLRLKVHEKEATLRMMRDELGLSASELEPLHAEIALAQSQLHRHEGEPAAAAVAAAAAAAPPPPQQQPTQDRPQAASHHGNAAAGAGALPSSARAALEEQLRASVSTYATVRRLGEDTAMVEEEVSHVATSLGIANLPQLGGYMMDELERLADDLLRPGGGGAIAPPQPVVGSLLADERERRAAADAEMARVLQARWQTEDELQASAVEADRLRRQLSAERQGVFSWEFDGSSGWTDFDRYQRRQVRAACTSENRLFFPGVVSDEIDQLPRQALDRHPDKQCLTPTAAVSSRS
jgi:hypothetical protein